MGQLIDVRPAEPDDERFVRDLLGDSWGGTRMAVHGELIDAAAQPMLIARRSGVPAGLLIYRVDPETQSWEIVSLDAVPPGQGTGTALIKTLRSLARANGAHRIWLVTTNANTRALRFYQLRGFDLVAVHRDAVTAARGLKPTIPLAEDGIPLRHEIELELRL